MTTLWIPAVSNGQSGSINYRQIQFFDVQLPNMAILLPQLAICPATTEDDAENSGDHCG
jgi:hypothetical protein